MSWLLLFLGLVRGSTSSQVHRAPSNKSAACFSYSRNGRVHGVRQVKTFVSTAKLDYKRAAKVQTRRHSIVAGEQSVRPPLSLVKRHVQDGGRLPNLPFVP